MKPQTQRSLLFLFFLVGIAMFNWLVVWPSENETDFVEASQMHLAAIDSDATIVNDATEKKLMQASPEIERMEKCTETRRITTIDSDPCYWDSNREILKQCNCRSDIEIANSVTYRIEPNYQIMDKDTVENDMLLAFIHINKAGGSSIKKSVIFPTLKEHRWDGAGFGMFKAWPGLGEKWADHDHNNDNDDDDDDYDNNINHDHDKKGENQEPLYIKCGAKVSKAEFPFEHMHKRKGCKLRAIWGGLSMGLCQHFPNTPCMYLIVIRDPLQRAISNYNYVCIEGAENRKKWKREWKDRGKCPLNIKEYFDIGLGEPNFLLWRLTRGCDRGCGVQQAIANLKHPCMRFLLLEEFEDGLHRLRDVLGKPYHKAITKLIQSHKVKNKGAYHDRIQQQLQDENLIKDIESRLKNDIEIYNAAKDHYKKQWSQPMASCNKF